MERPTATVSPLRQRMTDDMRMRKFEPKTQAAYLRAFTKLGTFLKHSPDTATADDFGERAGQRGASVPQARDPDRHRRPRIDDLRPAMRE